MRFQTVSPRHGKVISELRGSGLGLGFCFRVRRSELRVRGSLQQLATSFRDSARNLSTETPCLTLYEGFLKA